MSKFQGYTTRACGHFSMVSDGDRYFPIVVWKLLPDKVGCFTVNRTIESSIVSEDITFKHVVIQLNSQGKRQFVFVSVYGLVKVKDPAFLNPVDGMLNVGICPLLIFVPHPSKFICAQYTEQFERKETPVVKRRKRSWRAGTCGKLKRRSRTYLGWLVDSPMSDAFLVMSVTKAQLEDSFMGKFADNPFQESCKNPLFVILDPFWDPCIAYVDSFAPVQHYVVSKDNVKMLHKATNVTACKILLKRQKFTLIRVLSELPSQLVVVESMMDVGDCPVKKYVWEEKNLFGKSHLKTQTYFLGF